MIDSGEVTRREYSYRAFGLLLPSAIADVNDWYAEGVGAHRQHHRPPVEAPAINYDDKEFENHLAVQHAIGNGLSLEANRVRSPIIGEDVGLADQRFVRQREVRQGRLLKSNIFGTIGRIEIEIPFNIPTDLETRIYVTRDGGSSPDATTETVVFPAKNQYTIQAELFADAILNDSDVAVNSIDAVANMRVIDSILRQ